MKKTFKRALIGGFLEAADFFDSEEGVENEGFGPGVERQAAKLCLRFLSAASDVLTEDDDPRQAGIDFWLTQAGHGAGFWDGDWGDRGDRLTELAKSVCRDLTVYTGDDHLLYLA